MDNTAKRGVSSLWNFLLSQVSFFYPYDVLLSNLRPNCLQIAMLSTFEILECAKNHGKKSLKLSKTSFSSIMNWQGIPFAIETILIWNHDCFDCHREWNSERAVEMCRDFGFVRFHLLAFHFNEFRTCQTQPSSISRQTVEGSLGFEQTIKTSKVDRWFGLIGNQDRTKRTSFIAVTPHFRCYPDCFDYERNAMWGYPIVNARGFHCIKACSHEPGAVSTPG